MSKRSKAIYDAQEAGVVRQSAAIVEYLQKTGVIIPEKTSNEKSERLRSGVAQKKYHNTKLLLKKYRLISWVLECFPGEIGEELLLPTKDLDEIIARLDLELAMENRVIEEKLNTAVKTRLLLGRIQEALSVLQTHPNHGQRLYDVIYATYIDPVKRSIPELLEHLDTSQRTYYRFRKEAMEIISIRLWSSPSGEIDTWLDVIAMIEEL